MVLTIPAACLLVITGCADGEKAVPISGNVLAVSDSEFEVALGCYEEARVEVDEDSESVELRGYAEGAIGGDCARTAIVSLDEPLGDRDLVDGKTGRTIEVTPEGG